MSLKFSDSLVQRMKSFSKTPDNLFSRVAYIAANYPEVTVMTRCTNGPCPNPGKVVSRNQNGDVILCDRCSHRILDSSSSSSSDSDSSSSSDSDSDSMPPLEDAPLTLATMDKTKAYRVLLRAEKLVTTSKEQDLYPAIIIPCLIHEDMPAALVSPATFDKMNELHGLQGKYASRYALLDRFTDRDILFEHPLLPGLHVLADHHGDNAWQAALTRFKLQSKTRAILSELTGRF
jgi:hypothetical protein